MKKGEQLILGQLALSKGFIDKKNLDEATTHTRAEGNLISYLVETEKLNKKNLSTILEYHKAIKDRKRQDKSFARYLLENHLVDRHRLKESFRKQEKLEKKGHYVTLSKIIVKDYEVPKTKICNYKEEDPKIQVKRSLKRVCNLAKIYFNLGNNFLQLQDLNGAKKAYDKALKEDPDFIPALTNRSVTLMLQHNYEAAQTDLERIETLDPSNVMNYYNIGFINLMQKKYREAYSSFTKSAKLNNRVASVWNNRAITLHLLQKKQKAAIDIRKARKLNPKNEQIKQNAKHLSQNQ